nr:hemagglutinin repeat-containing protein [Pseudomonas sp. LS1212]
MQNRDLSPIPASPIPAVGGKDLISVYASVDMGRGKLERDGQKQQQAYLFAGDQLRFNSGNDTTIAVATLRGTMLLAVLAVISPLPLCRIRARSAVSSWTSVPR